MRILHDHQESLDLSLRPPFQLLPAQAKLLQNPVSPSISLSPIPYPSSLNTSTSIYMVVDPSTSTTSTSATSLIHPNPNVGDPSRLILPVIVPPNPNVAADPPVHPNPNVADPPVHPNPNVTDPLQQGRRRQRDPIEGRNGIIPAPYPWATDRRATVYSLQHLLRHGIFSISGAVECKKCNVAHRIDFDLETKFSEVAGFIRRNGSNMRDRAPKEWSNPLLPDCGICGKVNCVKPIIEKKKKDINWLFLFLGQMLGCCTLNQLKYFCKHTRNHRTGAKDRVLYLTYLTLADQLNGRISEA